jgi:hypothetical protein
MPSRQTVAGLISLVEQDRFIEALQTFYADDAVTQENDSPPRVGLPALIERERQVLGSLRTMHTVPVDWFVVEGDRAVIHWVFEFEDLAGRRYRLDELASQLWRGERIVHEHFYFDPAQVRR